MLSKVASVMVRVIQRWMPDPFLFAVGLTFLTFALGLVLTPTGPGAMARYWYTGLWEILRFAMQMVLVLVTGHALAQSPPVKRLLSRVASLPRNQSQAVVTVVLGSAVGSFLNWGFGLVVGATLAKRVASRVKSADFAFLVAGAYAGFMVWASGLSSSIALISATPGSKMNIIERYTGQVVPLADTLFVPFNLVPVSACFIVLPVLFVLMQPRSDQVRPLAPTQEDEAGGDKARPSTPAHRIEEAWPVTLLLVVLAGAGLVVTLAGRGWRVDINSVILLFLTLGLAFHRTPIRYVRAFNAAARSVGPLVLQYPLYGGIMSMMDHSGLAALFASAFVSISTADTLPFWSYVASNVISLFVPSGGGHWVVQGPVVVPAAAQLGASQAATAMAVAFGEQTANMIQPFWALPILAIAGLGIRDIMGYCVIAFVVGFALFGAALLVFG